MASTNLLDLIRGHVTPHFSTLGAPKYGSFFMAMATAERAFSAQHHLEILPEIPTPESHWTGLVWLKLKMEQLWVGAQEAVKLKRNEAARKNAYSPETYLLRAEKEWALLNERFGAVTDNNSLFAVFQELNARLSSSADFRANHPTTPDIQFALKRWERVQQSFEKWLDNPAVPLPSPMELRDVYWKIAWWSRLWHDAQQFAEEYILQPETSHFFYEIVNGHIRRGGYHETPQELNLNTQQYMEEAHLESARSILEGDIWQDVGAFVVNAPQHSVYVWTSPSDTPENGYIGTRSDENNPERKEWYRARIFVGVKTGPKIVDVTQYDTYPSLAELCRFQTSLGQAPVRKAGESLTHTLIKNLITRQFSSAEEAEAFNQLAKKTLFANQKNMNSKKWLKQRRNVTPEQRERFERELSQLASDFYLPQMVKVLTQPYDQLSEKANDEVKKDLSHVFSGLYGAMTRWTKKFFKNPKKAYSFTDFIEIETEDGYHKRMRISEAVGLAVEKPSPLLNSFINQFISHSGSLLECTIVTPFTAAGQVTRMIGGAEYVHAGNGIWFSRKDAALFREGNCLGCKRQCVPVLNSLCKNCNPNGIRMPVDAPLPSSSTRIFDSTPAAPSRSFAGTAKTALDDMFNVNISGPLKRSTSLSEQVAALL